MYVTSAIRNTTLNDWVSKPGSANMVYTTLKQTVPYKTYMPDSSCDIGSNRPSCYNSKNDTGGKSLDWTYDWQSCFIGGGQRKCSEPNPDQCSIGKNDAGTVDPFIEVTWYKESPMIQCSYDVNKIETIEQITEFEKLNPNNKEGIDKIMKSFCSKTSHECPKDTEGNPMTSCSRLKSLDEEGRQCREWASKQDAATNDLIIDEYCLANGTNKDCSCHNRASDPVYIDAKAGHEIPDGCWYAPCSANQYLQTSHIIDTTKDCPKNMCKIIYDLNKNNTNVIANNTHNINCNFMAFTEEDKDKDKDKDREREERERREREEKERREREERERREREERERQDRDRNQGKSTKWVLPIVVSVVIIIIIIIAMIILKNKAA